MSLKELIINSYGADAYYETNKLKIEKIEKAKLKKQIIFLQRCIAHKIIPKSMRVRSPIQTRRGINVTDKYRFDLLLCAKNDAKSKFFQSLKQIPIILTSLTTKLSVEHMTKVKNVTDESERTAFYRWKNRLKLKFEKLFSENKTKQRVSTCTVKPVTLNLCNQPIPEHHRDLLNLGPKFVPIKPRIPYMDIISKTESTALKIKYETKDDTIPMKLRQDILRDLKMSKPPRCNLSSSQKTALKEIRDDNTTLTYPFDKGAGLVRIDRIDAISKIEEQIGNTKIIEEDPTPSLARKFRNTLRPLY